MTLLLEVVFFGGERTGIMVVSSTSTALHLFFSGHDRPPQIGNASPPDDIGLMPPRFVKSK